MHLLFRNPSLGMQQWAGENEAATYGTVGWEPRCASEGQYS
jgi:hypothetical protein